MFVCMYVYIYIYIYIYPYTNGVRIYYYEIILHLPMEIVSFILTLMYICVNNSVQLTQISQKTVDVEEIFTFEKSQI
jgi:hypothetical protein